ncbi:MAG: polymer-forming cytoskeletal protein [Pseudomonadota bacterium]
MALPTPFFNKRDNDTFGMRNALASNAAPQPVVAPILEPVPEAPKASSQPADGGSKLTVGPNIKLKGVEITDCDTLVVEGLVEATMDSRVIRIAETGAFKGSAEIDYAEIRGIFDGNLTVREKLVIHATGRVTGKIHYGKLVIEEGGQLSGQIEFGTGNKPAAVNKPALKITA